MLGLYISGAFVIVSFMLLCFYVVSHFYYDFIILIRDLNLNDEIIETLDIVNKEQFDIVFNEDIINFLNEDVLYE